MAETQLLTKVMDTLLPEELEQAIDAVGDNIIYYNNYGSCSWDSVRGLFAMLYLLRV